MEGVSEAVSEATEGHPASPAAEQLPGPPAPLSCELLLSLFLEAAGPLGKTQEHLSCLSFVASSPSCPSLCWASYPTPSGLFLAPVWPCIPELLGTKRPLLFLGGVSVCGLWVGYRAWIKSGIIH